MKTHRIQVTESPYLDEPNEPSSSSTGTVIQRLEQPIRPGTEFHSRPSISDFEHPSDLIRYCRDELARRGSQRAASSRSQETLRVEVDNTVCATPGCIRMRQYPAGCTWDRCCKQCFLTEGANHEYWCDEHELRRSPWQT